MAGNKTGGKKAAAKNLAKDPDFYRKIGKMGAESYSAKPEHLRKPKGFAANHELARIAGRLSWENRRRQKV